jgi:hypothetical protein
LPRYWSELCKPNTTLTVPRLSLPNPSATKSGYGGVDVGQHASRGKYHTGVNQAVDQNKYFESPKFHQYEWNAEG